MAIVLTFTGFLRSRGDAASNLIDALGGPARLAARLGFDRTAGGTQRVHNWRTRGIPAAVRLAHPEIFALPQQPTHAQSQPGQGERELANQAG
jgi:hypothetical protein